MRRGHGREEEKICCFALRYLVKYELPKLLPKVMFDMHNGYKHGTKFRQNRRIFRKTSRIKCDLLTKVTITS